jgi:hypothetical protein
MASQQQQQQQQQQQRQPKLTSGFEPEGTSDP